MGRSAWGIDQARSEARRLQTLIDQGIDPRLDRAAKLAEQQAQQAEARRRETTMAEAWSIYLEARRPHWGDRYYLDHVNLARPGGEPRRRGSRLTTPGPPAPLLGLKLAEITADRVRTWRHAESTARPTQARQAFGALRTFLTWCEDQPAYRGTVDLTACVSRIARQELPQKGVKHDLLQKEQLHAWFTAVRQLQNPVIASYLQSLLLTGARREELFFAFRILW